MATMLSEPESMLELKPWLLDAITDLLFRFLFLWRGLCTWGYSRLGEFGKGDLAHRSLRALR